MLNNLQLLLDVDTILIGGGISAQPKLIACIKENMMGLTQWFPTLEEPVIKACKFNNDANLLGALCYYKIIPRIIKRSRYFLLRGGRA